MSTLISPIRGPKHTRQTRPPRAEGSPCGRIIERTTTVTREYVIEAPDRARFAPESPRWTDDELLRRPFDSRHGSVSSTDSAGSTGSADGSTGSDDGPARGSGGAADSVGAVVTLGTFDRLIIRLGAWLVGLGRRRAMHPGPSPEDIAARLAEAKDRDLRRFAGAPHSH